MERIRDVVAEHMARSDSGWSIGAFGAIAEFMRDPGEPLLSVGDGEVATSRGAMRIRLTPETLAMAYETVSARPERWLHGVAFCLDDARARMTGRTVFTELGPDRQAILEADRTGILFDIGAGADNVDACVRAHDPDVVAELRSLEGVRVIEDSDAMARLVATNPHRVFESRLGRIEVRQRIGSHDADPPTPEGPHTHVLPKVLAKGRTHSANLPLPTGLVPCLNLYPANPTFDALGRPRSFDHAAHERFQALLEVWGDRECYRLKARLAAAVKAGEPPSSFRPDGRYARAAARVALRQYPHVADDAGSLAAWREIHDPPRFEPEDHHPDH